MIIDKRLNLIVPVYGDDGTKTIVCYVHSTPLSREMVERHCLLLGQTFAAIFNQGLGIAAGPGMARMLLRKIAIQTGQWENADKSPGDGQLLLEEVRRLTTVLVPGEPGKPWQQVPLQVAVGQHRLSEDDRDEVENAVIFFIATSAVPPKMHRREMMTAAADLWGAQVSLSTPTEFATSLTTSTAAGSTGAKPLAPASGAHASVTVGTGGKPSSIPH